MFSHLNPKPAPLPEPTIFPPTTWAINTPYTHDGMTFTLEILQGETRSGKAPNGESWSVIMPAAYGFFPNIIGADKEDLDVYVASQFALTSSFYIVDQINPKTQMFDEHKVMMGFTSPEDATQVYTQAFSDGSGSTRLGAMTTMTPDQFKAWLTQPDHTTPLGWTPKESSPAIVTLMADLSIAPSIVIDDTMITITILSEFKADAWGTIADDIVRILQTASSSDTILFQISSPGGEVILASRIASAIEMTKATVITRAIGQVASAACLLWAEGHVREIAPASFFMQHMSSHTDGGKTTDVARRAVAMACYVRDIILKRAIDINLFTDDDVADMVDKGHDVYLSGAEVALRTGATMLGVD